MMTSNTHDTGQPGDTYRPERLRVLRAPAGQQPRQDETHQSGPSLLALDLRVCGFKGGGR